MSHTIQHRGTVERVEHDRVYVVVEQQSACAGCHAKSVCGSGGSQRIIEVVTPNAASYVVGESVIVALLRSSMGASSVIWGYMLPLVVLLVALFGAKLLGASDGVAACVTLVLVAAYYVVLYLMRRVFERKIKFTIIKE